MTLRVYRAALVLSFAVNVVLIGAIAFHLHFARLLDTVETMVSVLG